MKDYQAKPLRVTLFHEVFPAKYREEYHHNLIEVYNLELSKKNVEYLFDFPEVFFGENLDEWLNESYGDRNRPKTIGDLIEDISRSQDGQYLLWDNNLVARKFKVNHEDKW